MAVGGHTRQAQDPLAAHQNVAVDVVTTQQADGAGFAEQGVQQRLGLALRLIGIEAPA
jgi:hypothetical protein